MSFNRDMNRFLYAGMTPRAWRMISYCCVGFLIYGAILFAEILQNMQLNRIDEQLRAFDKQNF